MKPHFDPNGDPSLFSNLSFNVADRLDPIQLLFTVSPGSPHDADVPSFRVKLEAHNRLGSLTDSFPSVKKQGSPAIKGLQPKVPDYNGPLSRSF